MPDPVILDASRTFLDTGVIGAAAIFLMVALWWSVRQWLKSMSALEAEKDARLADAKEYAKEGEAMRNAMTSAAVAMKENTTTMQAVLEVVRDRGRA